MKKYQLNYATGRPQMYDRKSRGQKATRIIKTLEDLFGKKLKNLTLLDLGSSTGIMDNVLAGTFKQVVGIDIDKEAIKFAKKNFKEKNLAFKVDDAMKLSFPDNSFNVVVCAHTYEHVPDQKKLFSEIYRVLRPGGVCYLAAQNRLFPWEPHYNLPFLSWLPKRLVPNYYETSRTYWGLKDLVKRFYVLDYTPKILRAPQKYGYDDSLKPPISYLVSLLSPAAKFFAPTFFWLLVKK